MKQSRFLGYFLLLVLMSSLILQAAPSHAQDDESAHAAIVAQIPTLLNFEQQAPTTFVGEVTTSYAYIALVVQENLVVIYVCDNVEVGAWINAEIVDGLIRVTHESGIEIVAAVTATSISGTIALPVDDDGSAIVSHNFSAVPAVPGVTGLARATDEWSVSGWIVTENGLRGLNKPKGNNSDKCNSASSLWMTTRNRFYLELLEYGTLSFNDARTAVSNLNSIRDGMVAAGCSNLPPVQELGQWHRSEQP